MRRFVAGLGSAALLVDAVASRLAAVALVSVAALGCGNQSHPAPLNAGDDDASVATDGAGLGDDAPGFDVPPVKIDCSGGRDAGYCACTELGQKLPVLYLVLDKSGSMSDPFGTSMQKKWDVVRVSLFDLTSGAIRKVGKRVQVGMAVFPATTTACTPGVELAAPAVGTADQCTKLAEQLAGISPGGGTPTAATLTSLTTRISSFGVPTYVLLATDGGPNCAHTACDGAHCGDTLDGAYYGSTACTASFNCCDPKNVPVPAGSEWQDCVDQSGTVAAISALATAGIKTFVVGVPGSEGYADVLDAMANAGGTAQPATSAGHVYYAASDPASLTSALSAIAAKVIDSCTITLSEVPPDPTRTNVLVDGTIVAQDPTDGWTFGPGNATVVLHGAACDEVLAGVSNIQVATGCTTLTH